MKIKISILLGYLFLLMVLPCCAFDNCPEDQLEAAEVSCIDNPHQGGDKDGCGSCSPFFSCHHCAGFNLSVKTVAFLAKAFDTTSTDPVVLEDRFSLPSYEGNIWQPPRA